MFALFVHILTDFNFCRIVTSSSLLALAVDTERLEPRSVNLLCRHPDLNASKINVMYTWCATPGPN